MRRNTTIPIHSDSATRARGYVSLERAGELGWTLAEWCEWHSEWQNESAARQAKQERRVFVALGVMSGLALLALALFLPDAAIARP